MYNVLTATNSPLNNLQGDVGNKLIKMSRRTVLDPFNSEQRPLFPARI
jgi:hypothetical protein